MPRPDKNGKIKGKYYSGPGGIFYDIKKDDYFYLEPNGVQIVNKRFETIGRNYDLYTRGLKRKNVTMVDNLNESDVIRVGEA